VILKKIVYQYRHQGKKYKNVPTTYYLISSKLGDLKNDVRIKKMGWGDKPSNFSDISKYYFMITVKKIYTPIF